MLNLNTRVSICTKKKRIGRGGSRGGTSGRGHKGQNARSGAGRKINDSFEGGQMPIHRRLPKRGFTNGRFKKDFVLVSLDRLELICAADDVVTKDFLKNKGLLRNTKTLVKVLGNGTLSKKITIKVDACSASAREAIVAQGGEIQIS